MKKFIKNRKRVGKVFGIVAVVAIVVALGISTFSIAGMNMGNVEVGQATAISAVDTSTVVDAFTGAWSALAEDGATAVQAGVSNLFLDTAGELSLTGLLIFIFAGVSIGLGLLSWVMRKF